MWETSSETILGLFDVSDLTAVSMRLIKIFDALICTRFVLKFQYSDLDIRGGKFKLFLGTALYLLLLALTAKIAVFGGIEALSILFFFLFSLPFTSAKPYVKAYASILCVFVGIVSSEAISAALFLIFNRPYEFLYSENIFSEPLIYASAQVINLTVFELILRLTRRDTVKLEKKEWLFVLSILIISFIAVVLLKFIVKENEKNFSSLLPFCVILCFCAIIIICFNITVRLNKEKEEREKIKLTHQQNEFRKHYAENAVKQYDEIRRIRHDMKHSYGVIQTLLSEGKTEEIFDFIQKNASLIAGVEVFIDVGSDIINSLLNSKLSDAKRRGINVICNVDISPAEIDEADICSLLGNMIDNAAEACEKCPEGRRLIEVIMKSFEGKYLFEVSNSVSGNIFEENSALYTTKKQKELHGFGVKSIRSVAEKYGGSACFVQEGDMFRCDVVLMK